MTPEQMEMPAGQGGPPDAAQDLRRELADLMQSDPDRAGQLLLELAQQHPEVMALLQSYISGHGNEEVPPGASSVNNYAAGGLAGGAAGGLLGAGIGAAGAHQLGVDETTGALMGAGAGGLGGMMGGSIGSESEPRGRWGGPLTALGTGVRTLTGAGVGAVGGGLAGSVLGSTLGSKFLPELSPDQAAALGGAMGAGLGGIAGGVGAYQGGRPVQYGIGDFVADIPKPVLHAGLGAAAGAGVAHLTGGDKRTGALLGGAAGGLGSLAGRALDTPLGETMFPQVNIGKFAANKAGDFVKDAFSSPGKTVGQVGKTLPGVISNDNSQPVEEDGGDAEHRHVVRGLLDEHMQNIPPIGHDRWVEHMEYVMRTDPEFGRMVIHFMRLHPNGAVEEHRVRYDTIEDDMRREKKQEESGGSWLDRNKELVGGAVLGSLAAGGAMLGAKRLGKMGGGKVAVPPPALKPRSPQEMISQAKEIRKGIAARGRLDKALQMEKKFHARRAAAEAAAAGGSRITPPVKVDKGLTGAAKSASEGKAIATAKKNLEPVYEDIKNRQEEFNKRQEALQRGPLDAEAVNDNPPGWAATDPKYMAEQRAKAAQEAEAARRTLASNRAEAETLGEVAARAAGVPAKPGAGGVAAEVPVMQRAGRAVRNVGKAAGLKFRAIQETLGLKPRNAAETPARGLLDTPALPPTGEDIMAAIDRTRRTLPRDLVPQFDALIKANPGHEIDVLGHFVLNNITG